MLLLLMLVSTCDDGGVAARIVEWWYYLIVMFCVVVAVLLLVSSCIIEWCGCSFRCGCVWCYHPSIVIVYYRLLFVYIYNMLFRLQKSIGRLCGFCTYHVTICCLSSVAFTGPYKNYYTVHDSTHRIRGSVPHYLYFCTSISSEAGASARRWYVGYE